MKLPIPSPPEPKLNRSITALATLAAGSFFLSRLLNYHPRPVEKVETHNFATPPFLAPDQSIKLVTYNTQFFAGTRYDFFYEGGADTLVQPSDIESTIGRVAHFITEEHPDFVLLQEVDYGARRTGYLDELTLLRDALPPELRNYVSTYYWRSKFVPHPKIWGPAGTKLVIFSRYRLGEARRYRLPLRPGNLIANDFNLKRAILEVEIPLANGGLFVLLNAHLEGFPKGTNIMERQVKKLHLLLAALDELKLPWIIGGDFNLLPPGQLARLPPETRGLHTEPSEITPIYNDYAGVPTVDDATGRQMEKFFTFTRRSRSERVPVRTLDYFFTAPSISVEKYTIRQAGMLELSDHLPVIAEFRLPG